MYRPAVATTDRLVSIAVNAPNILEAEKVMAAEGLTATYNQLRNIRNGHRGAKGVINPTIRVEYPHNGPLPKDVQHLSGRKLLLAMYRLGLTATAAQCADGRPRIFFKFPEEKLQYHDPYLGFPCPAHEAILTDKTLTIDATYERLRAGGFKASLQQISDARCLQRALEGFRPGTEVPARLPSGLDAAQAPICPPHATPATPAENSVITGKAHADGGSVALERLPSCFDSESCPSVASGSGGDGEEGEQSCSTAEEMTRNPRMAVAFIEAFNDELERCGTDWRERLSDEDTDVGLVRRFPEMLLPLRNVGKVKKMRKKWVARSPAAGDTAMQPVDSESEEPSQVSLLDTDSGHDVPPSTGSTESQHPPWSHATPPKLTLPPCLAPLSLLLNKHQRALSAGLENPMPAAGTNTNTLTENREPWVQRVFPFVAFDDQILAVNEQCHPFMCEVEASLNYYLHVAQVLTQERWEAWLKDSLHYDEADPENDFDHVTWTIHDTLARKVIRETFPKKKRQQAQREGTLERGVLDAVYPIARGMSQSGGPNRHRDRAMLWELLSFRCFGGWRLDPPQFANISTSLIAPFEDSYDLWRQRAAAQRLSFPADLRVLSTAVAPDRSALGREFSLTQAEAADAGARDPSVLDGGWSFTDHSILRCENAACGKSSSGDVAAGCTPLGTARDPSIVCIACDEPMAGSSRVVQFVPVRGGPSGCYEVTVPKLPMAPDAVLLDYAGRVHPAHADPSALRWEGALHPTGELYGEPDTAVAATVRLLSVDTLELSYGPASWPKPVSHYAARVLDPRAPAAAAAPVCHPDDACRWLDFSVEVKAERFRRLDLYGLWSVNDETWAPWPMFNPPIPPHSLLAKQGRVKGTWQTEPDLTAVHRSRAFGRAVRFLTGSRFGPSWTPEALDARYRSITLQIRMNRIVWITGEIGGGRTRDVAKQRLRHPLCRCTDDEVHDWSNPTIDAKDPCFTAEGKLQRAVYSTRQAVRSMVAIRAVSKYAWRSEWVEDVSEELRAQCDDMPSDWFAPLATKDIYDALWLGLNDSNALAAATLAAAVLCLAPSRSEAAAFDPWAFALSFVPQLPANVRLGASVRLTQDTAHRVRLRHLHEHAVGHPIPVGLPAVEEEYADATCDLVPVWFAKEKDTPVFTVVSVPGRHAGSVATLALQTDPSVAVHLWDEDEVVAA
ncbi:hypothetical protein DIPPA_33581 [Diplonema papillatum]|nr:hypothetical protein DIPPA_33581 [Diplonema papillatum]